MLLRLFAPVIPFATEESWSWFNDSTVHHATWPSVDELPAHGSVDVLSVASAALIGIRRAKTDAKASQKTEVSAAVIQAPATQLGSLKAAADDLKAVGRIAELEIVEGPELAVTAIELIPAAE